MDTESRGNADAWFGRADTPAPQGMVSEIAPSLTVAIAAEQRGAIITVRYRRSGMSWQRLETRKGTRSKHVQYYTTKFPRFLPGTRVEYEVFLRQSGPQGVTEQAVGELCWFEIAAKSKEPITGVSTERTSSDAVSEGESLAAGGEPAVARASASSNPGAVGKFLSGRRSIQGSVTVDPVRLLDRGKMVAALQAALSAAGFAVAAAEEKRQRFGRSTRDAVSAFQNSKRLAATGVVDEETAAALNRLVNDLNQEQRSWRARLRGRERQLFKSLPKLGIKLDGLRVRKDDIGALFREALSAELKALIVDAFQTPSEKLLTAIEKLEVEVGEVKDIRFADFIANRVVPVLFEDVTLEAELEAQADRGFADELGTVSEVLELEGDIRQSERFAGLANLVRNRALGETIGLKNDEIDGFEETNLLAVDGETFDRFVAEGKIRAEQKDDLRAAADFARLTDDNFAAIRALWTQGIRRPKDLIGRDYSDWLAFLNQHEIDPPDGETRDSYAELLDAGVERAFPSAYAMERFAARAPTATLKKLLPELDQLRSGEGGPFVAGLVTEDLDLSRFPHPARERISNQVYTLNRFANRYAALGVRDILNDPDSDTALKRERLEGRLQSLARFAETHSDLDLKFANFFPLKDGLAEAFAVDFDGVEEPDRPFVRKAVMALQRTRGLTESFSEADALLSTGLDNAAAIMAVGDAEALAEYTGLSRAIALRVRAAALDANARVTHFIHALESSTTHAPFNPAVLLEHYGPQIDLINLLKDIPGYSELFGNQNYCKCSHCRSIFSPAAYFVDVMRFIETNISKPNFLDKKLGSHPLYLRRRRPDLWTVPLTCANTDTLIPYLVIVNEVLARYLENTFGETDIFKTLADAKMSKMSIRQPFNLPLAELLLYLRHLGVSRHEIVALFNVPKDVRARAVLELSPEEFAIVANPDTAGSSARFRIGQNVSALDTDLICRRASITREELARLLSLDFIRDNLSLDVEVSSPADDVIGFVETIKVERSVAVPLFLDRLHRFIRLWRALPWSPEEVQMFLEEAQPHPLSVVPETGLMLLGPKPKLNEATLIRLGDLRRLQQILDLTPSELRAVVANIPTVPPKPGGESLFERLFGARKELEVRHPLLDNLKLKVRRPLLDNLKLEVRRPLLDNLKSEDPFVSPDFGFLQGALKLDEAELVELIQRTLSADAISAAIFSLPQLSDLYRNAIVARRLGISLRTLKTLEVLASPRLVPVDQDDISRRIAAALKIIDIHESISETPFSADDISRLLDQDGAVAQQSSDRAAAQLTDIRTEIISSRTLEFAPDDLAAIDGIDRVSAVGVLRHLAALPAPWVIRAEDGTDRFLLAAGIGLIPDQSVLVDTLTKGGLPLKADNEPDKTLARLTQSLMALFLRRHPLALVLSAVRARLNLSDAFLEAIDPLRRVEPATADGLPELFSWLRDENLPLPASLVSFAAEIDRLADLFKNILSASIETIHFVSSNQALFALDGHPQLSWTSLRRIGAYVARVKQLSSTVGSLNLVLEAWDGTGFPDTVHLELAQLCKASVNDIAGLRDQIPVADSPFEALAWIEKGIKLARRLGVDSIALRQLASESYEGLVAARDLVHGAIRAKYAHDEDWRKFIGPYEEKIEGVKRDALVDRILSLELQLKFRGSREIYQFFLLDVDMDGCARTSRVNAAISSCQLYVQRCLMGLEQSRDSLVVLIKSKPAKKEWEEWRKYYRIWQANREVFSYPENYLLPDLRDDKSHIFEEAEEALLQGTLDSEAIDAIFAKYLRGLVELGSLIIVSCHYDGEEKNYIFFGRTPYQPFRYFMRRFDGVSEWTVWKPVNLDIGAKTVTAAKHRGRLYLLWTNVVADSEADRIQRANSRELPESENDGERQERIPVFVSYSCMEPGGGWGPPQSIFFYSLLTLHLSKPWFVPTEFSEKLYITAPGSTPGERGFPNSVRPKRTNMDPLNASRLEITHASEEPQEGTQAGVYLWVPVIQTGYLDIDNNAIVGLDGSMNTLGDPTPFDSDIYAPHWAFASSGIKLHPFTFGYSYSDLPKGLRLVKAHTMSSLPGGIQKYDGHAQKEHAQNRNISYFIEVSNSTLLDAPDHIQWRLREVSGFPLDSLLYMGDQTYLIRWTGSRGLPPVPGLGSSFTSSLAAMLSRRHLVKVSTSRPKDFAWIFSVGGIESLLSPLTQFIGDETIENAGGKLMLLSELAAAPSRPFSGQHLVYHWELFFHLPFLVGHYLNEHGKYEVAGRMFEYIFNPKAPSVSGQASKDVWGFQEFRKQAIPKLKEILADEAAISVYRRDPFNPFAIARQRPSAFQKAVVMRYIDNLLDWGDALFRRDTIESLTQATMLYVMAADILGERPRELGECATFPEQNLTYGNIVNQKAGTDFLVELQTLLQVAPHLLKQFLDTMNDLLTPQEPAKPELDISLRPPEKEIGVVGAGGKSPTLSVKPLPPTGVVRGAGFAALAKRGNETFVPLDAIAMRRSSLFTAVGPGNGEDKVSSPAGLNKLAFGDVQPERVPPFEPKQRYANPPAEDKPDPYGPIQEQRRFGFCVPPNEMLLGYWDRVDDRLFKIRNCMNIQGVVRQLALWQPRIDPLLLVRAKAAGLDIDQVLALLSDPPPQHRFSFLLEKARQFTSTAQQFGGQLMSALERKDEQELALLRSLHEDTVVNLIRRQKESAIETARQELQRVCRSRKVLEARRDYFKALVDEAQADPELGLNTEEAQAQCDLLNAKAENDLAAGREATSARCREIGPQWSVNLSAGGGWNWAAGGAFVIGTGSVSHGSENVLAAFERQAQEHRNEARVAETEAAMALRRADYKRRKDQWVHECDIAIKEIDALVPQEMVAEIHVAIAEQDLAVHDKQIEHAREIYDFARDRFTNLGLYTYLSTTLGRLYRQAYDMAYQMASTAQRAYHFETDDQRYFLAPDNWSPSRAGLLAADKLLLQLQAMEAAYLDRDRRRQEVTLPCPLSQIDPEALVRLRRTGRAEFQLPEWWFDLCYPGQYRRMLRAVRLTIPCVTGPYSNVGARLTLVDSALRVSPSLDASALVGVQVGRNTSISTSTASSDPGVFELRFDAPQNPPFTGAGAANSSWVLELPVVNRVFDYGTISDVIIELSYTAEDDGLFRRTVEGSADAPGTLDAQLGSGLVRIISLRNEFPSEFHKLRVSGQNTVEPIDLSLQGSRLLPYWLGHRRLQITQIDFALEPQSGREFPVADVQNASIVLNDVVLPNWVNDPHLGSIPVSLSSHVIELEEDPVVLSLSASFPPGLDLHDLLIRFTYTTV